MQTANPSGATVTRVRIGHPPIPHEHGAWVILYCSLLLGFGAAAVVAPMQWLLLTSAVTGAFLTREAASLLLRRRGKTGTGFWLGVYLTFSLGGGLPLLFYYRVASLLLFGALAVLLFGIHSLLLLRERLDRSQWGEVLGVGALTLAAPAACTLAMGRLNSEAWLLWVACLLYFSSGVFTVKMYLNAARAKREWNETRRREIGRDTLQYHLLLAGALIFAALRIGVGQSGWIIAAYLPALIRALRGWARLTPVLPPLKRVGLQEALLAVWFTGCLLAALTAWHSQ